MSIVFDGIVTVDDTRLVTITLPDTVKLGIHQMIISINEFPVDAAGHPGINPRQEPG